MSSHTWAHLTHRHTHTVFPGWLSALIPSPTSPAAPLPISSPSPGPSVAPGHARLSCFTGCRCTFLRHAQWPYLEAWSCGSRVFLPPSWSQGLGLTEQETPDVLGDNRSPSVHIAFTEFRR